MAECVEVVILHTAEYSGNHEVVPQTAQQDNRENPFEKAVNLVFEKADKCNVVENQQQL